MTTRNEVAEELERVRRLVSACTRARGPPWSVGDADRSCRGDASGRGRAVCLRGATIVCLLPAVHSRVTTGADAGPRRDDGPSAWPRHRGGCPSMARAAAQHRRVTRRVQRAHRRASCAGAGVARTRAAGAGARRRPLARLALRAPHRTHRRGGTRRRRGTDRQHQQRLTELGEGRRPRSRGGPRVAGGLTCQPRCPGHCCRPSISVRPATIARRRPVVAAGAYRALRGAGRRQPRAGDPSGACLRVGCAPAGPVARMAVAVSGPVADRPVAGLCLVASRADPVALVVVPYGRAQSRVARGDERRADARPPVAARHRRATASSGGRPARREPRVRRLRSRRMRARCARRWRG